MKQTLAEKQVAFLEIAFNYFGSVHYGIRKETIPAINGAPAIKGWCLPVSVMLKEPAEQSLRDVVEADLIACRQHNANGKSIYIRPGLSVEDYFLLLDDMNQEKMQVQRNLPGRLIIETSPGNFQIWLKLDEPLDVIDKQFHIQQFEADGGATPLHRWGRAPGFVNRKLKYAQNPPWARFVGVTEGVTTLPAVPGSWRAIKAQEMPTIRFTAVQVPPELPSRRKYEATTTDESVIDFRFALALIRHQMSDDVIASAIVQQRTNWTAHMNNIEKYLTRTIAKARDFANRTALPRTRTRARLTV